MQTLRILEQTAYLWWVPLNVRTVLRSVNQLYKARPKEQIPSYVCSNRDGQKCSEQGRNLAGIEITRTSFYYKGHE